jgi:hypothetical protein
MASTPSRDFHNGPPSQSFFPQKAQALPELRNEGEYRIAGLVDPNPVSIAQLFDQPLERGIARGFDPRGDANCSRQFSS